MINTARSYDGLSVCLKGRNKIKREEKNKKKRMWGRNERKKEREEE